MKKVLWITIALWGLTIMSPLPAATASKSKNTFTIAPPKDGKYAPWSDPKKAITYYAGEITTIEGGKFHYTFFTDNIVEEEIAPDFSGPLKVFKDHIFLDHPGVPFPYRITGYLDGAFVMITWKDYEHWKKFGHMPEFEPLYLQTK